MKHYSLLATQLCMSFCALALNTYTEVSEYPFLNYSFILSFVSDGVGVQEYKTTAACDLLISYKAV